MSKENQLATIVVDCCFRIHKKLGPGLLESVYEEVLCYEFRKLGISYKRQLPVDIFYDDLLLKSGFRADVLVDDCLIVELKSVEGLIPVHYKQLLTYLRLTEKKLGLLVNFNANLMKDGMHRVVNGL